MESLEVECRADAGGSRVPVRVGRAGRMRRVARVLDRWPGADHCYFRVLLESGELLVLRHQEPQGVWQLVFYRSERPVEGS